MPGLETAIMKTQPKTTRKKTPDRTEDRGGVVYVAYQGNSSISLPAPGQGFSYVFERAPVKNRIDAAAWAELSDRKGPGAACVYIDARKMRKTGRGDGFDKVKDVRKIPIVKAELPQVTTVDTSKDTVNAQLLETVNRLTATNEQLLARLSELEAKRDPGSDPGSGNESSDDEDILDPAKLSIPKLAKALDGLDVDDLEEIKRREETGKARPKALAAIDAAIDRALEDDSEPEEDGDES